MNLYPLIMTPCFRSGAKTPWGGCMLGDAFLKDAPAQTGESLEVSVMPGEESLVRSGACAGRTLPSMQQLWAEALTGAAEDISVSIKLIDVDAAAPETASVSNGTVIWVILNCDADGVIYLNDTSVPVRPGNVYRIPAGTTFKAGPSMQIYEAAYIGNVAANNAGDASRNIFGTTSLCKGGSRTYYVSDNAIEFCRLNIFGKMPLDDARMLAITPFAPCSMHYGAETVELMPFDTVIIPAALNGVVLESDDCKVMMASVSDREALCADLGYRSENVPGLTE